MMNVKAVLSMLEFALSIGHCGDSQIVSNKICLFAGNN